MLLLARLGLGFYLLLAPFGISFREIGGTTATVAVALYYVLDWRNSVLRRHPLRWVFAAFLGLVVLKSAHSMHPSLGWYTLGHSLHATFFLGVAGLEAVREWRHARGLFWCAALMACAQGLTGVWQHLSACVFQTSATPCAELGRLTGTMDSPRVGNLLSLVLPLALAAPLAVLGTGSGRPGQARRLATAAALIAPALYLLLFSMTRSALAGLLAALLVMAVLRFPPRYALPLLLLGAAGIGAHFGRLDAVMNDPRWTIWRAAWDVFLAYPLLGSGIETFGEAYPSLGIRFDFPPMPHPHNIYMQFLSETGIMGFAAAMAFLVGTLLTMLLPLWRRRAQRRDPRFLLALAPAAAWAGYMVTALSAHSFFRTWWLGLALAVQGLGLACARLLKEDRPA